MQFGTNHLGPFALTNLLLPQITDRVVTVSSSGHRMRALKLDDLNWQRRRYSKWPAYGQTKLANLLFTLELQRRLNHDHSTVRALAAHPGLAGTNLFRPEVRLDEARGDASSSTPSGNPRRWVRCPSCTRRPKTSPGASYVGPNGRGEQTGYPTLVGRSADASDVELAKELWLISERLTGVTYPTSRPEPVEGP